jgi:hypothetical protein
MVVFGKGISIDAWKTGECSSVVERFSKNMLSWEKMTEFK